MTHEMFDDLIREHGKYCPTCGSGRVSSRNEEPMHHCLDCDRRFENRGAVIGLTDAVVVARGYAKRAIQEAKW